MEKTNGDTSEIHIITEWRGEFDDYMSWSLCAVEDLEQVHKMIEVLDLARSYGREEQIGGFEYSTVKLFKKQEPQEDGD